MQKRIPFTKQDMINILLAICFTALACGLCFWLVCSALDAQASNFDKKLEQQRFYSIIKSTHNQ